MNLPRDLHVHTLSFLEPNSLCRAAEVSRGWNVAANDRKLWFSFVLRHKGITGAQPAAEHPSDQQNWKRAFAVDSVRNAKSQRERHSWRRLFSGYAMILLVVLLGVLFCWMQVWSQSTRVLTGVPQPASVLSTSVVDSASEDSSDERWEPHIQYQVERIILLSSQY